MRITVDAEACTGHGRCYALAPDVYAPDDRGHCELLVVDDVPPELVEQARAGEANCPERAIAITEQ
jgi:ferredoxin